MKCPSCGHLVADNARFCPNCGTNLSSPRRACLLCGRPASDSDEVCSQCFAPLDRDFVRLDQAFGKTWKEFFASTYGVLQTREWRDRLNSGFTKLEMPLITEEEFIGWIPVSRQRGAFTVDVETRIEEEDFYEKETVDDSLVIWTDVRMIIPWSVPSITYDLIGSWEYDGYKSEIRFDVENSKSYIKCTFNYRPFAKGFWGIFTSSIVDDILGTSASQRTQSRSANRRSASTDSRQLSGIYRFITEIVNGVNP